MSKILIVDDEPEVLRSLRILLESVNYHVLLANDGDEAIQILEQTGDQISAVILDWSMPTMSGIEVLRWIKLQPTFEYLPVIMHTGMKHPANIREGIESGAFYYLTKPTNGDVIISIVN